MAILTDIAKILEIKKNIHRAIRNKGVTIPNNTLLEDYPRKIAEITGGEGVDSDYAAMLVLEGISTGTERDKSEIEVAVAAVLETV